MNKILLMFLLLIGLSGCAATDLVVSKGAEINDGVLVAAEFTICSGASIGSIRRHYGSEDASRIWQALCNTTDEFSPNTAKKE